MSSFKYSAQINDDQEQRQSNGSGSVVSMLAIMVAVAGITMASINMTDLSHTTQRLDDSTSTQSAAVSTSAVKSVVSSAIAAHPSCSLDKSKYQACMDTMRVARELSVANSTVDAITNGHFTFKSADAALVVDHKVVAAGPNFPLKVGDSLRVPNFLTECDSVHTGTCITTSNNQVVSYTAVEFDQADKRRSWGNFFSYGSEGAGMGSAIGGGVGAAFGPEAIPVGAAVGGAVGAVVGGAVGAFN